MRWFRSNIKHGSRLALLALAIQFVLSFGHHHGAEALAAPVIVVHAQTGIADLAAAKTLAAKQLAAQGVAAKGATDRESTGKDSAANPAKPAQGHHTDRDVCAICALMSLARTVLFTEPPMLRLPEAYHFLYLTTDAEFNHLESQRVVFQPRAPPTS